MLRKLLHYPKYSFSFRDMKKAFFQFLNLQVGAVYRGTPQFKQRKYLNIQIGQKFKQMQSKRKQQRLMYAQRRKLLLQKKLSTQAKLLTQSQTNQLQKINIDIKSLQTIIDQQNKQLAELDQKLEQTQAEYILVEGLKKLIVLNQITYLQHINTHPSGVDLTPESIKVVQNIHYLVTHNLPVQRYKLYELMPDLFTKQIDQLEQSTKKLIQQKNLNIFQENTSYSIRQWKRADKIVRDPIDWEMIKLKHEKQVLHVNMCLHANQIMKPHTAYIQKVIKGQTPFRNLKHCITSLCSEKLKLNLTEQEQAFKKTTLSIFDDLQKWKSYKKDYNQRQIQLLHSYIEPPVFVKRHPLLLQKYDQFMQRYTNPIKATDHPTYLPNLPFNDDGRAFMEERIRKQIQHLDEQFQRLWNTDKEKLVVDKKKIEIEFYNISTRILEQYQALQDKSAPVQQFKRLPKKPKKREQPFVRITVDEIAKIIHLNNKDSRKYNLDFFAKYYGMEQPQKRKDLFDMFNSLSFLRVFAPTEDQQGGQKQFKQEVIKFVG